MQVSDYLSLPERFHRWWLEMHSSVSFGELDTLAFVTTAKPVVWSFKQRKDRLQSVKIVMLYRYRFWFLHYLKLNYFSLQQFLYILYWEGAFLHIYVRMRILMYATYAISEKRSAHSEPFRTTLSPIVCPFVGLPSTVFGYKTSHPIPPGHFW